MAVGPQRKLTLAASMRRPADVNNNLGADQLAASPPTNGRRRGVRPFLPFPGKGFSSLSPIRPASIRTLCGAVCSGAGWGSQSSTGADYLGVELLLLVARKRFVLPQARSHPNSAIRCPTQTRFRRPALCGAARPCCCARVRRLRRSPTSSATTPPACAPPPRSPSSSHSCRRARPASAPSA